MSTNRNVANLSITIVKTLVKMAGLGRVADMIDGSQECLNLLADIKNDALDDPNAEMIRSLHSAVKSEIKSIEGALKQDGMSRKLIKKAVAQLSEAARDTIKELAKDDDALIRAVQQPENFGVELKRHTAPRSDGFSNNMQAHYTTLLDRISQEFLILAPWSPNFDRVALTSLLRCFPALSERIDRLEQHMDRRFDHIELGMREDRDIHIENNQLLKGLSRQNASPIFDHVVFGSRPDVVAGDSFVPRGEQEQLNALIADPTRRRTVLVGMRGCGKTQLAAALAEKYEDKNWSLVAWVNAVSSDSIKSSLVELAKKLKIDTSDQPTPETIIRRCFDQLKSEDPSDRLIIFDNVENIDDLRGLVPRGNGLRVVATTTNNTGWEHQGWDTIKVGVFHRDESINYLLTATESTDRDAADTLAHRLGDLPLALAQAAATARNGNLSLARYLDRLDCYRSKGVIRPVPGDYYTDDVATALCMAIEDTLENLEDGAKQAARYILGALALLAESGVPTRWLDSMSEEHNERELHDHDRDVDEDAHDALTELLHKSIVQQSTDKTTTMLHRLQAQTLRESWDKNETAAAYESTAILLDKVDVDSFPRNDTDLRRREVNYLIEQFRIAGAQKYSLELFADQRVRDRLASTLVRATDLGLPNEALYLRDVVEYIHSLLGPERIECLKFHNGIAHAYENAGYLTEAITIYEQLVTDSKRLLGNNSETTSTLRNNLAGTYVAVGRLNEGITIYKEVASNRTAILGAEHPSTLKSLNNLAHAYQQIGEVDKAIKLLENLTLVRRRTLGPDHPDTLTTYHNLAFAYQELGQLDTARELYEQIVSDSRRIQGAKHPNTLRSSHNLAYIYEQQGRFDKAADLYRHVLSDRIVTLGENHPETISSRNSLAGCLLQSGKLEEAFGLYEQVLIDRARILGKDHPDTLTTRNNIAYVYQEAGLLDQAITIYEQVLTDRTRILGKDHPHTLASHNNLAYAYSLAGRVTEAIPLFEQVLTDRIRILGEDHPEVLTSRNNLASAYSSVGRVTEAIPLFEQVLTDRIRILGEDHPETLAPRNNLACAYFSASRQNEAIPLFEQILKDSIRVLGEDQPQTLAPHSNLAGAYLAVGRADEAITQFEQALAGCTRVLDEDHPLTKAVRENLEAARRELEQQEEDSANEEREQED